MADAASRIEQAKDALRLGDREGARSLLQRALRSAPQDAEANGLLCFVLYETGELEGAVVHGERAVAAAPADAGNRVNLGMALLGLEKREEAVTHMREAARLAPDDIAVRHSLCLALAVARRHREALAEASAALDKFPAHPGLGARYAAALAQTGRSREAVRALRDSIRRNPDDLSLATDLCSATTYAGGLTPGEVFAAHEAYGKLLTRLFPHPGPPAATDITNPQRRLRVGFVSRDLREHAVPVFLLPLLKNVRKDMVETALYSTGGAEDEITARLKSASALYRRAPNPTHRDLAALIRRDKIDILFDLSGHTVGHALAAFQLRPAPVQATWLGFPNTTGLRTIDYRVTDSIADPPGEASDPYATEKLWRLDPCFLCWSAPEESHALGGASVPEVGPLPCDAGGGGVTFGSFNSINKLDDGVVALWSRLLAEAPGSTLLLKHSALKQEEGREIVRERFAPALSAARVAPERLALEGPEPYAQFLGAYNRVDIALDPFPFGGATTTCDALFMGAPVITLRGERTAGRVCASILTNAGLGDLVAAGEEEYISITKALAAPEGRERLRALRSGLRGRFLASPVCDAPAFARRFEKMLREMWARHCAGRTAG